MPENRAISENRAQGRFGLGAVCTLILAMAYAMFILAAAFAPELLARPIRQDGATTWAFAAGLAVMALSFALTCLYAAACNRRDRVAATEA